MLLSRTRLTGLKFKGNLVDLGSKVEMWEFIEKMHPKSGAHPLSSNLLTVSWCSGVPSRESRCVVWPCWTRTTNHSGWWSRNAAPLAWPSAVSAAFSPFVREYFENTDNLMPYGNNIFVPWFFNLSFMNNTAERVWQSLNVRAFDRDPG